MERTGFGLGAAADAAWDELLGRGRQRVEQSARDTGGTARGCRPHAAAQVDSQLGRRLVSDTGSESDKNSISLTAI